MEHGCDGSVVPFGKGYPAWFRARVLGVPGSMKAKAAAYGVHISSVYRFAQRLRKTGYLEREPARGGRTRLVATDAAKRHLHAMTLARPELMRHQAQDLLDEATGVRPSLSSVSRMWRELQFTRKTLRTCVFFFSNAFYIVEILHVRCLCFFVCADVGAVGSYAATRDEQRRINFWTNGPLGPVGVAGVFGVSSTAFIDIDECGIELRECERRFGHALRGQRTYFPSWVSFLCPLFIIFLFLLLIQFVAHSRLAPQRSSTYCWRSTSMWGLSRSGFTPQTQITKSLRSSLPSSFCRSSAPHKNASFYGIIFRRTSRVRSALFASVPFCSCLTEKTSCR